LLIEPCTASYAAFVYGGPLADAIHRYKYRDRSDLAPVLGSLMAERAVRWRGRVDVVVPVPLHWRRRRSRGYDQAALLAVAVARSLRLPARLRALRRVRQTKSQVELPHEERRKNVAGAFEARGIAIGSRVLLVDDVRTTGATLEAASSVLREAGAREVHAFVLAARVLGGGT
jgi:ComF family protein